jgi:ribose 5-phosphate isomerase A
MAMNSTPSTQDQLKALVADAALAQVPGGQVIGVGTGSTVDLFIDALAAAVKAGRLVLPGAVSSSERSTRRLQAHGITVVEAGAVERLAVYVDGADEIDGRGHMIKGGGAALTREKIVADLAERFVCIADGSKLVEVLGRFPVPVEVVAMAVPQLVRRFARLGGRAVLRDGVLTDNGHPLLDVHGLQIHEPVAMESEVNQWPGVVTVGIFGHHRAQTCLLGTLQGIRTLVF